MDGARPALHTSHFVIAMYVPFKIWVLSTVCILSTVLYTEYCLCLYVTLMLPPGVDLFAVKYI